IYLASRIGPFIFAGIAAFVLSQSAPTTTNASSRTELTQTSERSLQPPISTAPVPLPQVRRPPESKTDQSADQRSTPSTARRPNENPKVAEAVPEPRGSMSTNPLSNNPMPVYPPAPPGLPPVLPPTSAPPLPPAESIASLSKSDESAPSALDPPGTIEISLDPSRPSDAIQIQ